MKQVLTFCAILISAAGMAQNNFGDIIGKLIDLKDGLGIPGAIAITYSGEQQFVAETEVDGRFRMSAVPSGQYQISFVYLGDTLVVPQYVEVTPDGYGDIGTIAWVEKNEKELPGIVVTYDPDALHLKKGAVPEIKLSAIDIKNSASRFDVKGMLTGMSSEIKRTDDGLLQFRGARAGDMICYLDGIKMRDVPQIPSAAYKFMTVYTGAIPAKYGDTNGGVVVIETNTYMDLYSDWKRKMNAAKLKD